MKIKVFLCFCIYFNIIATNNKFNIFPNLICCVVVYKFEQRISLYINASTKSTSKICCNKQYIWPFLLFTPESLFDQNISAILTTTSFLNAAYRQLNDIDEPECQKLKKKIPCVTAQSIRTLKDKN